MSHLSLRGRDISPSGHRGDYFAFLPPPPPRLMGACVMVLAAAFFSDRVEFFDAAADFLFSRSCLRFETGFLSFGFSFVCFLLFAISNPRYFESPVSGASVRFLLTYRYAIRGVFTIRKRNHQETKTPARVRPGRGLVV